MARVFDIHMIHMIGDLGHIDNTIPYHRVPRRLFKIEDDLYYPEIEHPILLGNFKEVETCDFTTIFHLAYCPNLWDIKKRYECHLKKSQMHTPQYLENWKNAHLLGEYPTKKFNPLELPDVILNEFGIDKDMFYFHGRTQMEVKHYQDAIDWKNYFGNNASFTLYGCGCGQRVYALIKLGMKALGVEKSEYACKNSKCKRFILQKDITIEGSVPVTVISICYDVLEHIEYDKLDIVINNVLNSTKKYILISVPFKGTPDCTADSTHIIKEDKDWWAKQFIDKGLKLIKTPNHFLFREQVMIFQK